MRTHDERYDAGCLSNRSGFEWRSVCSKTTAQFPEYSRLFLWKRDLRDGTQTSFGKEAGLVVRQIQQGIKDFRSEFQQVERLGNAGSGHAQMLGQVCLRGTSALFDQTFENERLLHRIDRRRGCFFVGRCCAGVCGFKGRYEKLAHVHSRKVNPEGQIEKVRKSFGRGEPVFSRHPHHVGGVFFCNERTFC